MKIIFVEWEDSASLRGWTNIAEGDFDVAVIKSVGWLVKETPTHITLSTSVSVEGGTIDPITIPKAVIKKRKKIL